MADRSNQISRRSGGTIRINEPYHFRKEARRFRGSLFHLDICERRGTVVIISMSNNNFSAQSIALKQRLLLPLVATFFILALTPRCVAATAIYSTGFEASEGYNINLDLVGQNGWMSAGSGGNGLLTDVFPGRGQQAYIGYAPPASGDSYLFVWQPINKALAHVQFSVTVSVFDSTTTDWDDFYWGVYNQEGDELFSLDFDNYDLGIYYYLDGTNSRVWSGLEFTNGVAYPLRVDLDFTSNRWSATFNGALLATNEPITTIGSPLNLGDIDPAWIIFDPNAPGDNYMVFDDYLITASLPPPQLRLLGMLGSAPVLRLSGSPDTAFAIEASTNLVRWVPLNTNVTTGGSFDYVDNGAAGLPRRFYRGRWVP